MNEQPSSAPAPGRKVPWKLIGFLVPAAIIVLFVLQNREEMNVNFLSFEVNSRQWVALLVAVALGVIADRMFIGVRKLRRRGD